MNLLLYRVKIEVREKRGEPVPDNAEKFITKIKLNLAKMIHIKTVISGKRFKNCLAEYQTEEE